MPIGRSENTEDIRCCCRCYGFGLHRMARGWRYTKPSAASSCARAACMRHASKKVRGFPAYLCILLAVPWYYSFWQYLIFCLVLFSVSFSLFSRYCLVFGYRWSFFVLCIFLPRRSRSTGLVTIAYHTVVWVFTYACMVKYIARVRINRVWLSILLVVASS